MAENTWTEDLEPTAQPRERPVGEADDEKVVPISNVGGAAPTAAGLDSGGNLPGSDDDLANLAEDEPDEPPEISAVSIRDADEDEP